MVALADAVGPVLRFAQSASFAGRYGTCRPICSIESTRMASNAGKGSIAQQMANVPRAVDQGMAGKDVASALRDAAIASSVEAAAETSKEIRSLIEILGPPKFLMGDQKPYPDQRVAGRVNRKMAVAAFILMPGVELHANVYADDTLIGQADKDNKQEADRSFRVSVPKAIYVDKNNASAVIAASAWSDHTLNLYDEWASTVAASTPVQSSSAPRLVKRVQLVGAALPAAKPAAAK